MKEIIKTIQNQYILPEFFMNFDKTSPSETLNITNFYLNRLKYYDEN